MIQLRNNALPLSLAALLLWGLAAFFSRMAMQRISPPSGIFYEAAGSLLAVAPIFFFLKGRLARDKKGIALTAGASGVALVATLAYFSALRLGTVATVVTITAMYPVIVLLLAWGVLGERMNRIQLMAIGMAMAAIWLLAG